MDSLKLFDSAFLNAIFIIGAFAIIFVILLYLIDLLTNYVPVIKSFIKLIADRAYIFLIPFPVVYLVLYYTHFDNGVLSKNFYFEEDVASILKDLSIWFFTIGIFSSTLKYLNTITYVKKKFKEIVLSKEFDDTLSKKLEVLAYSDEFLSKHNNIEDVWKKITLIKYKQAFPEIFDKLKSKLNNDFFNKQTTPFYYTNFSIVLTIELKKNNELHVKTTNSYNLIRPDKDEFIWNFYCENLKEDHDKIEPNLKLTLHDGEVLDFDKDKCIITERDEYYGTNFEYPLKDRKQYNLATERLNIQNIDKDRILGFGTNRIIDHLDLTIICCNKLNYVFTPANRNIFKKEHISKNIYRYVHNDVLLPGEAFRVFLTRKN